MSGKGSLEADLEEVFRVQVLTLGGHTIKLAPMQAGIPDRLVMLPGGRLELVELKREGEDPSPIQRHWHAKLARLGVTVTLLYGHEDIIEWGDSRLDLLHPERKHMARRKNE